MQADAEYECFKVSSADFHKVWATVPVKEWMERVVRVSKGRMSVARMVQDIQKDDLSFWLVWDVEAGKPVAFYTLRVLEWEGNRVLAVEAMGGAGLGGWQETANDTIRRYGRDLGCGSVEMHGRVGWSKVLPKLGWKKAYVTYEMKL